MWKFSCGINFCAFCTLQSYEQTEKQRTSKKKINFVYRQLFHSDLKLTLSEKAENASSIASLICQEG